MDQRKDVVGLVNVYPGQASEGGTVVRRIVEDLSYEIRMGRLKPGERLLSEKGLGQKFGAGRSSVREALQILNGRGLVETKAGRGTFVTDFSAPEVDSMAAFWDSRHEIPLGYVIEIRLVLEPQAAALAALRANNESLRQIDATLQQMIDAMDTDSLSGRVFADIAFHDRLLAATGNPLYRSQYKGIEPLLFDIRRMGLRAPDRSEKVLQAHTSIYQALCERNSDRAAKRMREHILEFPADMGVELASESMGFGPNTVSDVRPAT